MTGPARLVVPLPDDARPPRIGKIRLGHGIATGRKTDWGADITRPVADDHFVVTADEAEITLPETVAAFTAIYGPEPRQLRAMLIGDTPEANLEGAYRLYGSSKLKRRCNGQQMSERTQTGGWADKPCACAANGTIGTAKGCKLTWTLHVLLPDVPGFGVWQIDTGSDISVRRMTGFLRTMHSLRGTLAGLEFDLRLAPVQVAPEGQSKTVYVLDPRALDFTPRAALTSAAPTGRYELPAPIADDVRDDLLDAGEEFDASGDRVDTAPTGAQSGSALPQGQAAPAEDASRHEPVAARRDASDTDLLNVIKAQLNELPPDALSAAKSVLQRSGVITTSDTTIGRVARRLLDRFGDDAVHSVATVLLQLERDLAATTDDGAGS